MDWDPSPAAIVQRDPRQRGWESIATECHQRWRTNQAVYATHERRMVDVGGLGQGGKNAPGPEGISRSQTELFLWQDMEDDMAPGKFDWVRITHQEGKAVYIQPHQVVGIFDLPAHAEDQRTEGCAITLQLGMGHLVDVHLLASTADEVYALLFGSPPSSD